MEAKKPRLAAAAGAYGVSASLQTEKPASYVRSAKGPEKWRSAPKLPVARLSKHIGCAAPLGVYSDLTGGTRHNATPIGFQPSVPATIEGPGKSKSQPSEPWRSLNRDLGGKPYASKNAAGVW